MDAVFTFSCANLIKCTQTHTEVITSTLRGSWRDINTRVWQILLSVRGFVVRYSAHVVSDLIKKLLMVTVFYRDNVYVDIRALNGCDIHHLAVAFPLMEDTLFLKVGPLQGF